MKKITMADVAKHAHVSKSTVSQYLNKRYDYMGEDTKQRIQQSILQLGYQPNAVARSLKQKKTSTIGVIVANILHAFSTQVIRMIEDVCHEKDYHVIICNADDDPHKEKKYIDMLRAKQVDGLIVFPTGGNVELYLELKTSEFPLVFMDRIVPGIPVETILLHNENASILAMNHFFKSGYEKIAFVTTSLHHHITPRIERLEGYKKALGDNGIPFREEFVIGMEVNRIKEGLKEMFSQPEIPQAILAGNDLALMEVLNFVKEHELRIPGDLALIGIDEVSFANIYSPTLTTVMQPASKMGQKAAALLFERIESGDNQTELKIHRFEPELIDRESC